MKIKGRVSSLLFFMIMTGILSGARNTAASTYDDSIPAGPNFDKAFFRLWLPGDQQALRGILVLVPGSNGDGRDLCMDPVWQGLASDMHLAVLGCYFTDRPGGNSAIEAYAEASKGSGQALLDVLKKFAQQTGLESLGNLPLVLWGHSAGGQFNYEFACWKPKRVLSFVVNKGGVYYTALASQETRSIPGLFFTGEKDLVFRTRIIEGIFAVNRRFGAIWTYVMEPGAGHEVGGTKALSVQYFREVLPLRLGATDMTGGRAGFLPSLTNEDFLLGDPVLRAIEKGGDWKQKSYPSSWLPGASFAEEWLRFISGGT